MGACLSSNSINNNQDQPNSINKIFNALREKESIYVFRDKKKNRNDFEKQLVNLGATEI